MSIFRKYSLFLGLCVIWVHSMANAATDDGLVLVEKRLMAICESAVMAKKMVQVGKDGGSAVLFFSTIRFSGANQLDVGGGYFLSILIKKAGALEFSEPFVPTDLGTAIVDPFGDEETKKVDKVVESRPESTEGMILNYCNRSEKMVRFELDMAAARGLGEDHEDRQIAEALDAFEAEQGQLDGRFASGEYIHYKLVLNVLKPSESAPPRPAPEAGPALTTSATEPCRRAR